jgi:hypothetical protein
LVDCWGNFIDDLELICLVNGKHIFESIIYKKEGTFCKVKREAKRGG